MLVGSKSRQTAPTDDLIRSSVGSSRVTPEVLSRNPRVNAGTPTPIGEIAPSPLTTTCGRVVLTGVTVVSSPQVAAFDGLLPVARFTIAAVDSRGMHSTSHNHTEPIGSTGSNAPFDPATCTRPVRALLHYYAIACIPTLFAYPIVLLVYYFKYHTLRYSFDEEGIRMSWGILFRNEINLTYRRIQDIHLSRNIIQRWMGLATVSVQTASGGGGPEMRIEGIHQYESLRDFLYTKMRGAKGEVAAQPDPAAAVAAAAGGTADEALMILREIRDHVAALRSRPGGGT